MPFNSDELLKKGNEAAENVIQNQNEVKEVLNELKKSLSKFLSVDVDFFERTEFAADVSAFIIPNFFKPKEKTGFNIL